MKVGVIGGGVMGTGVAQNLAQTNHDVVLIGISDEVLEHGRTSIRNALRLQAEFVSNNRNRMMYITYKFSGFKEVEQRGELTIFENDLTHIQPFPPYVQVHILD